jgi:hypothetical protein
MPKALTLFEQNFISEYEENGGNAKRAYLKLRPSVQDRTAEVNASKLLRKTEVVEELKRRIDVVKAQSPCNRQKILDRFEHLGSLAEKEKQFTASIHANREIAKISGLYEQNSNDDGYIRLIQKITNIKVDSVQINSGMAGKKADVIDLSGKDN